MRQSAYILFLSLVVMINCAPLCSQSLRLESEYKLDIPLTEVDELWNLIQANYAKEEFSIGTMSLTGETSIEHFFDTYFDVEDGRFAEEEISLRYRKRFKDGALLKKLVQLKTPYSEDKVVRNEIKFEVDDEKGAMDVSNRHEFLRHIAGSDMERLHYELAALNLRPEEIQKSLKLKQVRSRVYIKDSSNESVATITLDQVSNAAFPFQKFAELELELNEVRYTRANETEKQSMTALNNKIKEQLLAAFPSLKVDQRSKYRKMKLLIEESNLSYVSKNMSWFFLALIVLSSFVLFIKDELI